MEKTNAMTGKPSIDKPWLKWYSEEAIRSTLPKMTMYQYLLKNNEHRLSLQALEYFGRIITFEELFEQIEKCSRAFSNIGVQKGDIVTICMPNTPELIYMLYALNKMGAIVNMVDVRTNEKYMIQNLEEVNSKYFITLDNFYSEYKDIPDKVNLNKMIVVPVNTSLPLFTNFGYLLQNRKNIPKVNETERVMKWKSFINSLALHYKEPDYEMNAPSVMVHTGGTTGKPKGALLSNDSINALAFQYKISGIDFHEGQNFLNILVPFVAYGICSGIHMPLSLGIRDTLIPQFDPKKFDDLLIKYRPNHVLGVPSYYKTWLNSAKMKDMDLSFLITAGAGGDSISSTYEKELNEFLSSHNAPNRFFKGYGLTEASSSVCTCLNNCNEIGSVGIPLPKNIISIFSENNEEYRELSYNQLGEICIQTPTRMLEYYQNEKETKNIFKKHSDGTVWIHTGDVGYMTENGILYITDRIKRIIIRSGYKIYPKNIEEVISTCDQVKSCCVIATDDKEEVHAPVAYISLREKKQEYLKKVKELCETELLSYNWPVRYELLDEIPLTPLGKTDFRAVEELEQEKIKKLTM